MVFYIWGRESLEEFSLTISHSQILFIKYNWLKSSAFSSWSDKMVSRTLFINFCLVLALWTWNNIADLYWNMQHVTYYHIIYFILLIFHFIFLEIDNVLVKVTCCIFHIFILAIFLFFDTNLKPYLTRPDSKKQVCKNAKLRHTLTDFGELCHHLWIYT